jgi:preprotein translocase subunit SecD
MPPQTSNLPKPGRYLATLLVIIVLLLAGVLGKDALSPGKWHRDFSPKLGLDLSSGTEVTLRAETLSGGPPPKSNMDTAVSILTSRVNGQGVSAASVDQQGSNLINVSVPGAGQQQVVSRVTATALLRFRQVLLEAPGSPQPSATPTPSKTPPKSSPSSKPSSTAKPSSSPHALGPPAGGSRAGGGQGTAAGARELAAGSSAAGSSAGGAPAAATPPPAPGGGSTSPASPASPSQNQSQGQSTAGVDPTVLSKFSKLTCGPNWQSKIGYTAAQLDNPNQQIVACSTDNQIKYVLDSAKVLGENVKGAQAGLATSNGVASNNWQVNLSFDGKGSKGFGDLTTAMSNQYGGSSQQVQGQPPPRDLLAIVLDGTVVSAPAINQGPITGGQAQITGSFTQQSASQLANNLNYGALPLRFSVLSADNTSPTLGKDQLNAGLIAGAIGLFLVVLYSLFYYRGLALVSVSSLLVAAVLTALAVLNLSEYQNYALTLAGITGLIVAIGITADSFIVFFERLRDEVREGRSLRAAVERGWQRARRTILVSDTVSFLAALLLYIFSIGDVRGFAYTLGITTLIDVVVVFLFTKPMVSLLARTRFYGNGHRFSGLDPGRLGARSPWRGTRRPARTGSAGPPSTGPSAGTRAPKEA